VGGCLEEKDLRWLESGEKEAMLGSLVSGDNGSSSSQVTRLADVSSSETNHYFDSCNLDCSLENDVFDRHFRHLPPDFATHSVLVSTYPSFPDRLSCLLSPQMYDPTEIQV